MLHRLLAQQGPLPWQMPQKFTLLQSGIIQHGSVELFRLSGAWWERHHLGPFLQHRES
jgi:hypothetical protein